MTLTKISSQDDHERLTDELANLLNETTEAHHKASEGEDPDWPLWYADYLLEKLRRMLKAKFAKSELIYLVEFADKKNVILSPSAYWPRFYAKFFLSRYL